MAMTMAMTMGAEVKMRTEASGHNHVPCLAIVDRKRYKTNIHAFWVRSLQALVSTRVNNGGSAMVLDLHMRTSLDAAR